MAQASTLYSLVHPSPLHTRSNTYTPHVTPPKSLARAFLVRLSSRRLSSAEKMSRRRRGGGRVVMTLRAPRKAPRPSARAVTLLPARMPRAVEEPKPPDRDPHPFTNCSIARMPLWNSLGVALMFAHDGAGSKRICDSTTVPKLAMTRSPCQSKPSE